MEQIISPIHGHFTFKEDKYLLGKSEISKEEFDNLLFVRRDIKEIYIPSNITILSYYAFHQCTNLTKVEISPNSNLQTIGKHAFSNTRIKEDFIQSKVSIICECAFNYCKNLQFVEFSEESELKSFPDFCNCSMLLVMTPLSLKK